MGPPEEGREKPLQKCSKFPLVWGAVVCVSLCMLSVSHQSSWPDGSGCQCFGHSSLPVCPMCISICLA